GLARLRDAAPGPLARGRPGGAKLPVTPPRLPRGRRPAPPLALAPGVAVALAPMDPGHARGRWALDHPGALMGLTPRLPALRVAPPTVGPPLGAGRSRPGRPTAAPRTTRRTRAHVRVARRPRPPKSRPAH